MYAGALGTPERTWVCTWREPPCVHIASCFLCTMCFTVDGGALVSVGNVNPVPPLYGRKRNENWAVQLYNYAIDRRGPPVACAASASLYQTTVRADVPRVVQQKAPPELAIMHWPGPDSNIHIIFFSKSTMHVDNWYFLHHNSTRHPNGPFSFPNTLLSLFLSSSFSTYLSYSLLLNSCVQV